MSDQTLPDLKREIRVFLSSTSLDMQEERDLLVKDVFPQLRYLCARRFVTFTEVDFRWGISAAEVDEGRVLPICLDEIHKCRPYFIGLLGERYGTAPKVVPSELLTEAGWPEELHPTAGTSYTELEMLHGVLNNPDMDGHAFFYLRHPNWIDTLPAGQQTAMREGPLEGEEAEYGPTETAARVEERKQKLAALKTRILKSGLPAEHYESPEDVAKAIKKQFEALIDQLFPADKVPELLEQERLGHAAYAKNKRHLCIDRPAHLHALTRLADRVHDGKGGVLTGESGHGKSALLAAWVASRRTSTSDAFVFEHYFGSTAQSATVDDCLIRLFGELKKRFDLPDEVPADPAVLRAQTGRWLANAGGRVPIVIVLDALNQIEADAADKHLGWLPEYLPPHVTLVVSSLEGTALDVLIAREWPMYDLPAASPAEIDAMVETYLAHYRKTLPADLQAQVVASDGARNPLYLRTVLEELRQFGSHDHLAERVQYYLGAHTLPALFQRVIDRWQEDFEAEQPGLVGRTLTALWAAKTGLDEGEWLAILGGGDANPFPRAKWMPLFVALAPHLSLRAGRWSFGHPYLKEAVAAEYITDDATRRAAHVVLADYFDAVPQMTPPKAAEWPYQLQEAEEWDRLQAALLTRELFEALFTGQKDDRLGRYWAGVLLARPNTALGPRYAEAFSRWEAEAPASILSGWLPNSLGLFLVGMACWPEAEELYRRALEIDEASLGPVHHLVATELNNLAELLRATNRLSEAEPLFRRALRIDEASFGPDHPQVAINLNNLALLLQATNRLAEAEPLYRQALKIDEASLGPDHPTVAIDLNNLGGLLHATNWLVEAEALFRRALKIGEASLGRDHPVVALDLNNLASLLQDTERLTEAEPLCRRALAIAKASLGPDHHQVATALNNLAVLLYATNRLGEAEPLYRRALEIDEASLGSHHPDVARDLSNLASLLSATNRLAEAKPLYRRALAIKEASFGPDHPSVAISLNNLALLLEATNRQAEAEPLYRRAVEILVGASRAIRAPFPNLQTMVNNYAAFLKHSGRQPDEIRAILHELAPEYF